jgi:hypothetical protein
LAGAGLTKPVNFHRLSLPLFLFPLLLLAGCASPVGEDANAFDHYLTEEVTMVVQTPSEPGVPEGEPKEVILRKGTRVRLVERGSAMSMVETMNGERGRVPAIDLEATDENRGNEPQAKMGKSIQW